MKRKSLAFFLILMAVASAAAFAAKTQCPRYSALLEGTTVFMGTSYTERVAVRKIGPGEGYDGLWAVDTFEQVIKYPHPLGVTINRTDRKEMSKGVWGTTQSSASGITMRTFTTMENFTLEVAGNKLRAQNTTFWLGKVEGSQMSWKFDQKNPNEPTVTGTIMEGPKEPVELALIEPKGQAKYAFDSDNPGKLSLVLKARVTPASYEGDVQWDIPEIEGSKRTTSPASARGSSIKVEYEVLPSSVQAFGNKTIKATLKVGSCTASESCGIQIFYARDAVNNPGGKDYNWFYYWKQTPAARPKGQLVAIEFGGSGFDLCSTGGVAAIFKPAYMYKTIHVCDLTKKFDKDFTLVYPKVKRSVASTLTTKSYGTTTHIDTFAVIILHEYMHFLAFHNWREGKSDAQIKAADKDDDGIPDDLEVEMGFKPTVNQTFWGNDAKWKDIGGDEEFLAYEAMYDYKNGTYDAYDWGYPGKNWKKNP